MCGEGKSIVFELTQNFPEKSNRPTKIAKETATWKWYFQNLMVEKPDKLENMGSKTILRSGVICWGSERSERRFLNGPYKLM